MEHFIAGTQAGTAPAYRGPRAELMFALGQRNGVALPGPMSTACAPPMSSTACNPFLDLYYLGASVLIHEQDFFDLTWAYLERCVAVTRCTWRSSSTPRPTPPAACLLPPCWGHPERALQAGEAAFGISWRLIMSFLRHLSEEAAFATWQSHLPHLARHTGSARLGSRATRPASLPGLCRARGTGVACGGPRGGGGTCGLHLAGDPGLGVQRIDHGVRCVEDPALLSYLADTGCPSPSAPSPTCGSGCFDQMAHHNVLRLLEQGLCVTVNSDDPAYFGGYMNANFQALADGLGASQSSYCRLQSQCRGGGWLSLADKVRLTRDIRLHAALHGVSLRTEQAALHT